MVNLSEFLAEMFCMFQQGCLRNDVASLASTWKALLVFPQCQSNVQFISDVRESQNDLH